MLTTPLARRRARPHIRRTLEGPSVRTSDDPRGWLLAPSSPTDALRDGYALERELGRGGMASAEAGARWTARHEGTFVLTQDQAFELAKRANAATLGAALKV